MIMFCQYYLIIFLFAIIAAAAGTFLFKIIATKLNIVDKPNADRKLHSRAIPLLGGLAIFFVFFIILYLVRDKLLVGNLEPRHWLGFFMGAVFLMIGGFLDDKYNLKPQYQIIWPILAALSVIIGGVEIAKITNPTGGFLYLNEIKFPILFYSGAMHYFVVLSDTLIFLWLIGMMYTTKLLDGVDGLVSGVAAIGSLIIFLFTMSARYYQPDIGLAALIFAGACLGFLIFNWHPAKIFLGEGGSLLLGYILGVLAIISGGKIAIALLIMGLPILDVLWTIIRRIKEGKNPFRFSDRKHLHFKLLDAGLSQRQTVLIYYLFATIFGLAAVFLQGMGKLFALGVLVGVMLVLIIILNYWDKKIINKN